MRCCGHSSAHEGTGANFKRTYDGMFEKHQRKVPEGFYKNLGPTRFWLLYRPPWNLPIRTLQFGVFFGTQVEQTKSQNIANDVLITRRVLQKFWCDAIFAFYRPPWNWLIGIGRDFGFILPAMKMTNQNFANVSSDMRREVPVWFGRALQNLWCLI